MKFDIDFIDKKIKEIKLNENAPTMELTDLNLKPGKTYELIICEYSTTNSHLGHNLKVNNITSNINSANSGYKGNCAVIYQNGETRHINPITNTIGLAYTNGWDMESSVCFTKLTLEYFNKNWIGSQSHLSASSSIIDRNISIVQSGQLLSPEGIEAIHTIGVYPFDGDLIGIGSYMILYEK